MADLPTPRVVQAKPFVHTVATRLKSLPAIDLTDQSINRHSRKQLPDQLTQSFRKRWHVEYLHTLQSRQKWNTLFCPVKPGMVVLLVEENVLPLHWRLGIIRETSPDRDGIIRVALVKTRNGLYKRPAVKLCPLPNQ
ncbi:hypothetical protein ILUMI_16714 [Ignelater luminosus]|uniref:DUF5641 domain-containing protein n=1 Tax=Ignelater luminosus TaxID=2038154 RepID=A0A8K0CN25_IGNLU|nr:hypothetical protein ILUMI_16714 [Ignelater luminosus]